MPQDGASRETGEEERTGVEDHSIGDHSIRAGADLVGDGLTGAAVGGGPERTVAGLEMTVHVTALPDGMAAVPASTADTISSRTSLTTARAGGLYADILCAILAC